MLFPKAKVLKGLECCAEFLCDECPYQKYEHDDYKLRCIHLLVMDLNMLRMECEYEKA